MPADETLMARIAGVCVLLSIAAEYGAIAVGTVHGGFELIYSASFGSGERLAQLAQSSGFVLVLTLGLLAPFLTMVAWLAMHHVLARGGTTAFAGVVAGAFGMFIGIVAEAIRLSMVMTLPSAYVASSEPARPMILALGKVLGQAFEIMDDSSFFIFFAVGVPLIAIAIVRGRQLPEWLGWSWVIPTICVGYIGAPLMLLGWPIADAFMTVGMNIFFLTYAIIGILLLRWRPVHDVAQ
jgi:hypothetical protein